MRLPSYEEIKPYIEKGLLTEQTHPEDANVKIFNYTPQCQFSRAWDDVTLQCRGLIMDVSTGEVLARPFPKFFNYDEFVSMGGQVPSSAPLVYDKMDGSLGIMYTLKGKTWIATRGSFMSDQAQWATKWWRDNKGDDPYGSEVTYLFEIIYPENRIVVNYDYSGLVHLASIYIATGKAIDDMMPVKSVDVHTFTSVEELVGRNTQNAEGFVLFWPDENLRLKIKFEDYKRLHKVMTGLSVKGVWEHLMEKGIDSTARDIVEDVPDEFFNWLTETVENIKRAYTSIYLTAQAEYDLARVGLGESETRAVWASFIMKMTYPALGFMLLDKKNINDAIFKMIKPRGANTFKQEEI